MPEPGERTGAIQWKVFETIREMEGALEFDVDFSIYFASGKM